MTIDEVIEKEIYYTNTEDDDRYHKQIVEWLEELKAYKEKPVGWMWDEAEMKGYNKAIDDFVNALADDLTWLMRFGDEVYITVGDDVQKIAEQLKVGGENE